MEYRKFGERYYIRMDKGDEILSSLSEICACEGIKTAKINGIGGCQKAVVGVFDLEKKDYDREEVNAMLELISLDGNVTYYESKPYIHAHATFAYQTQDGRSAVLSGHLLEAVIGLTGEIILTPANGVITRRFDDTLGIRIWEFS